MTLQEAPASGRDKNGREKKKTVGSTKEEKTEKAKEEEGGKEEKRENWERRGGKLGKHLGRIAKATEGKPNFKIASYKTKLFLYIIYSAS